MKIPHDKFCVLPWVSIETSPIGTVRPCCLAIDEIVDDQGNKFKLTESNFDDIRNSKHMIKLRQEFLDGQQPQTCRRCWNEERAGRTSKRMHTLNRLKHMGISEHWTADAKPLMFLDLKLGNICNLKCRICGSWSSSQFAAEELNFISDKQEKKNSFHYQMLRDGAWPRESEHFWQQLDSTMSEVRYIEFTGGEPFMIQEHFDLLKRLIDRGYAHQIEIHYNTNGTQYPEQAEEIWQYFKHVEIAFSIDDVGTRFEYQRTNAVWSEVCDNIVRFRDMRDRNLNMTLQVCCTVNVFNVLYLEHVAQWIDSQDFDFVYWNILHDAYYFSIATLTESAKQAITQQLQQANIPQQFRAEIDRIVDFMNKGNSLDGELLRRNAKDLDFKRNQSLSMVSPEFAALIDYDTKELVNE
jgi:MoaA/NifB/PqqE/SkfB family radical SAM enzyme